MMPGVSPALKASWLPPINFLPLYERCLRTIRTESRAILIITWDSLANSRTENLEHKKLLLVSWTWCGPFYPSISIFHMPAGCPWMLPCCSSPSGAVAWPWKWHSHRLSQRANLDPLSPQYSKPPFNLSDQYLPLHVKLMEDPPPQMFARPAQFYEVLLVVLNQWDGNKRKQTVDIAKSRCPWEKVPLVGGPEGVFQFISPF